MSCSGQLQRETRAARGHVLHRIPRIVSDSGRMSRATARFHGARGFRFSLATAMEVMYHCRRTASPSRRKCKVPHGPNWLGKRNTRMSCRRHSKRRGKRWSSCKTESLSSRPWLMRHLRTSVAAASSLRIGHCARRHATRALWPQRRWPQR